MERRPPRSTRTATLFPYTTLCRSLASLLPRAAGVVVAVLPRGSELDDGVPLLRVTDAAQGVAQGMITLLDADAAGSTRLVLVGNSYGALLAYETAWRLVRADRKSVG